ncbi:MAG: cytidylyltransferase domain-containing protein [Candidatus Scalindua sp.]
MKIGAIVQARTSSTRLPGKVLKDLPYGSGINVLQHVIRRLRKSRKLDDIIIATTQNKADKKIVELSDSEKVKWFKGSEEDVLSRYYFAAKENSLDIIVRVTSDCPCIDPEIVDNLIEEHLKARADYTSNALIRTYPHGLDAEIINFSALEKAFKQTEDLYEREHVTEHIILNRSQDFNIHGMEAPKRLLAPDIRITIDTEQDYALLCAVFEYLYAENNFFNAEDIIKLFYNKPWLRFINKDTINKKKFDTLKEELEEAVKILDLQELERAREILIKQF